MSCCGGKKKKGASTIPTISLSSDLSMPVIAQGIVTHEPMHPGQIHQIVETAINVGHRHFDSAPGSRETELGKALHKKIKEKKIAFSDIFVTSKLANTFHDKVRECCETSLARLGLPYIHLYLIQSPCAIKQGGSLAPSDVSIVETWKQMEKLVDDRLVKAIGLANFNQKQIQKILDHCKIKPALLQVESHIYFQNKEIIQFCRSKSIIVAAYGPFASPGRFESTDHPDQKVLLEDTEVKKVADIYNVSPAQVALRFLQQRGIPAITRGIHEAQQKQNLDVFNFHIKDEHMELLSALETGGRVVTLISLRDHPEYPFRDVLKRLAEERDFAEAVAKEKARDAAPKLALPPT